MSNLFVFGFENQHDAFAMRAELGRLQSRYLIEMEDAVVVTRDDNGKIELHQAVNLAARGALGGTFWGSVIGLLFMNPLLGAAIGAGTGALAGAVSDVGISDQFMKDLGATLKENTSALFVLVRRSTPDKVLEGLEPFVGTAKVLMTSLSKDKEDKLREVFHQKAPVGMAP